MHAVPGLHRRAVRRPRQGLVPHRHQPVARPARSSTPARWRWSWASRPACRSAAPSRSSGVPDLRATRPSIDRQLDEVRTAGRAADGAGQQVRQRAVRRRRRRGRRSASLVNAANFLETGSLLGHAALRAGATPSAHDKNQFAAPEIDAPSSRTRCSARSARSSASPCSRAAGLPAAGPLQQRGLTDLGEHLVKRLAAAHMLFDPDHMSVKARNALLDLLEALRLPRRAVQPLVVDARTPTRGSTSSAASSRRTPATRPASSRSGASHLELGRPALLLRLRLRRRHERPRRAGRPARRRRRRTR